MLSIGRREITRLLHSRCEIQCMRNNRRGNNKRFYSAKDNSSSNNNNNNSNNYNNNNSDMNTKTAYYMTSLAIAVFGLSYASVPLYKVFCQMTGFGGTTQISDDSKTKNIKPVIGANIIKVYFMANVHSEMPWHFTPTQREIKVIPGETALAFYTVKNKTKYPITGVATYNVHPPKAGLYFNKIQCFCFEEQRLGAEEEIDMPVFFYIDPDIVNDPSMKNTTNITLSYTFFKTGDEKDDELIEGQKKEEDDNVLVVSMVDTIDQKEIVLTSTSSSNVSSASLSE